MIVCDYKVVTKQSMPFFFIKKTPSHGKKTKTKVA